MKDEAPFSHDRPPPTTSAHEHGVDSDGGTLSSPSTVPQDVPSPVHPSLMQRRLTSRHYVRLLVVAMVVLVVLAGGYGLFHAVAPLSRHASSAFHEARCPFPLGAGLIEGQDVRCGELTVPENRSQPKSPSIRLAVAIFKTSNPRPAPDPLLVLGGGPGVPQLATTGPLLNASNLTLVAADRDYILLDQRGVGYSQPSLRCQNNETMGACHDRLVSAGINLNAYTTLENAADVHDLVRALGYKQVDLDGVSYGSRLALTVMRLFPADLRSVVLISVVPPQVNVFADRADVTQHAFDVLFHGCAADPHCNSAYPHLQTIFYRLVTDLDRQPITFQATDQETGARFPVRFTGDGLVSWLFQALYRTDLIPQLPAVLFQILHQDYTQLSSLYGSVDNPMSLGLFYSVECGEDMAYTTPQRLQASLRGLASELQSAIRTSLQRDASVCQIWRVKAVPAVQKKPVTSAIPTLILEGEYDPVTPPANGRLAAQTLSRSFFFLFPGVGHGADTTNSCQRIIAYAFLDSPTEKPDASCISSMNGPSFT